MKKSQINTGGDLSFKILAILNEIGPMTVTEISKALNVQRDSISPVISIMRKRGQIHRCDWSIEADGERKYPRAIYKAGQGKDKPYVRSVRAVEKRTYDVSTYKQAFSWVFDLGLSSDERNEKMKKVAAFNNRVNYSGTSHSF